MKEGKSNIHHIGYKIFMRYAIQYEPMSVYVYIYICASQQNMKI